MTNKIRATVKRTEIAGIVEQKIELSMVDKEGYEQIIGTIHVDEIEMSADFIQYLYNGLCMEKMKDPSFAKVQN